MEPVINQQPWNTLQLALQTVGMAEADVQKITEDLNNITKEELSSQLIKKLPQDQLELLKSKFTQNAEENINLVQVTLEHAYSPELIQQEIRVIEQTAVKEYLEFMLTKVSSQDKKESLTDLLQTLV